MKRKILSLFLGRKSLQGFFENLHKLSLYGMQYGSGVFVDDSGEENSLNYIKDKFIQKNTDFILFDVGANKGEYSLMLNRIFQTKKHKIFSFEPSLEIYNVLKKNLSNFSHIYPHQIGLGDAPQKLILNKRSNFSGMNSIIERKMEHYNIDFSIKEEITIDTIDQFCNNHKIEHIDFLKLDVEGYEFKCLQGAKNLIENGKIDFIQFEFGSTSLDARVFFQDFWYLLKDKYTFYRIVKNGLVPIKKYNERLEIFRTSNFLLERK